MTKGKLDKILADHKKWLNNRKEGKRADLHGADLSFADLSNVNLLVALLKMLGLAVRIGKNHIPAVYDSDGRGYVCFYDISLEGDAQPPGSLSDFLSISYFEHYSFPGDYKIISNPFYGMSPEEAAQKLHEYQQRNQRQMTFVQQGHEKERR